MKRFYRSTGGKIFLALLCILCVCAVGVAAFGELLIFKSGYRVYSLDEKAIFEEKVKDEMYLDGHFHLASLDEFESDQPEIVNSESNLIYELYDSSGRLLGSSANNPKMDEDAWMYTFTYHVKVKDGKVLTVSNDLYPGMVEYVPEEVTEAAEEVEPEELIREEVPEETSEKKTTEDKKKKEKSEKKEETKSEKEEKAVDPVKPSSYTEVCTVKMALREDLPVHDWYYQKSQEIHYVYKFRYGMPILGLSAFFLGLLAYILILLGAGRRPDSEAFAPLLVEGMPWDVVFFAWCIAVISFFALLIEEFYFEWFIAIMAVLAFTFVLVPIFLGLSVSFAARLKQKKLLKTCLVYKGWRWVKAILRILWSVIKGLFGVLLEGFKNLPLIWRSVLVIVVLTMMEGIVILMNLYDGGNILIVWCFEKMLLIPLAILIILNLRRLEAGAKALAEGNLSHHTDCDNLLPGIKQSADNLNKIGIGMYKAVEERLKSERLKTELITNVSHDIKTPLTSVMNYAELINRELSDDGKDMNPERVREFSEVLVRQSERLKKLLEDLVEASKAATGNLEVDLVACNAGVFLNQIAGEYEEKLQKAGLHLVQKLPEKELIINADGRRMWRLFSNLMNNICKYSLAGSRVYLTLEEVNGQAVFSFKNTSRDELNLTEEELVERFTRGDASRHTEGSGLGLAIAKSMADLQGGSMKIITDGDLFKVEAAFPIIGAVD